MVRGNNSRIQMGRRGRPSNKSSESTSTKQPNESRKSNYLYLYSGLDETLNTPNKQSNNQLNNVTTTPQIRTSTRLTKNNSLLKNNHSTSTSSSKQRSNTKTNNGKTSNTTSKSLKSRTKKRKSNKWESSTDEEDNFEPAKKRRGAYLEAYQNSSYYDDDEEEDDEETENEEFNADQDDQDSNLAEDETADTNSSNNQNVTNFQWKRAQRLNSPPQFGENLPELELPESSQDLLLTDEDVDQYLLQICSIYEILKHFKNQLRLSSFRVEEFIAALQLDEMNSLCSEIHITLLKILIKEDEVNSTMIGSNEVKDSVNIHLYACDTITWPQVLKMYLLARSKGALLTNRINEQSGDFEAKRVIKLFHNTSYPIGVDINIKLSVLQYLCDSFLETNVAREEISNIESMTIKHDDHCRKCHKLGDLLCCDNCNSVWHLGCLDPPLSTAPTNEWICHICRAMNIDEIETATVRKEILGWDRNGRKYWWLCQRLIVEQVNETNQELNKVWYYSTKSQFNELINVLDRVKYEKELVEVLLEMNDEICKGFDTIYQLTQNAITVKGLMLYQVKSWLEICLEEAKIKEEEQNKLNNSTNNNNDLASTNSLSSSTTSSATGGIITRTKTGAIHQTTRVNESSQKNLDAEDQNILYIWDFEKDDRFLKRMNKKYIPNLSSLIFKLGMEAKTYVNYFNVNILALNKYQLQEERDKKRQLSWKFSFTPLSEFKWLGATNCSNSTLVQTLRKTFIQFENNLQSPFLHPNWSLHRTKFLAAVQVCNNAKDFALALSILESSIKPVLFNPVWLDSLGHNLLERTTIFDREERKKIEKRERREQTEEFDMLMRLGGVKYTLIPSRLKDGTWSGQGVGRGVHQLWKQRGEEYRVTGKNGWFWRSSTRVHHKCTRKVEILKIEELTEEEQTKVENTETINVMRALRLNQDKRIFYPKHFNKKACAKLELIEGLLEKRIRLKKALELEKIKMDKKFNEETSDKIKLTCYSPDCRSLKLQGKERDNLKCYSYDCRQATKDKLYEQEKENSEEEMMKEINETFICVKPVYLYNVTEKNEIQRKLNAKRLLGKGQLPPCSRFTTKSGKKSIFVLPNYELRKLGRSAALREVCGFSYSAKSNPYIWPFHSTPRPLFRTCWLYRNSIIEKNHGLESVALSLRIIWHCIRWDDMANKPASNTITTETDIITTELLKRRDLAPFGIRSEYLVRKIVVPIEFENEKDDNEWRDTSVRLSDLSTSSKREGLRERKKKVDDNELRKQGPSVTETWTPEEELQLWEIRAFGEKLEKQQQMIKERERERIQKENLEKARKLNEERLREERNKKLLNGENARVTPVIQKSGQIKRVLATQQNNNSSNQQPNQGFAMIRTLGGQTYKIPVSALQGKKPGQQIVIKTGNANSGQFTNTTTATIISTCTQPTNVTTSTQPNNTLSTTTNSTLPSSTTVRPLIISSGGNTTNLATGISASSLQQNKTTINLTSNQSVQPKIQFVKQITTPTVTNQPISIGSSTTATVVTNSQPNTATQTSTTIKLVPNTNLLNNSGNQTNTQVQIPIKLPDGRVQIIQLPASMLNSSQPIQIAIPQQLSSSSSSSTNSTPINTIIRTIQAQPAPIITNTSSPQPTIIRTITSSSNSSPLPTVIRAINASSPTIRTINASSLNNSATNTPVIRTITPVTKPTIIRTVPTTKNIIQQINPSPKESTPTKTLNVKAIEKLVDSTSEKSKPTKTTTIASNVPLLLHQELEDQLLHQSDNQIKTEESSFKLTPQYKQEMVKAALSSKTNTPEIHQKLLALQKHTQQQAGEDIKNVSTSSSNQLRRSTAGGLIRGSLNSSSRNSLTNRQSNQSRLQSISCTKGLEEERDDIVVKTIIKAMIDKIEKDEKLEQRRKKNRENQLQAKWRQSCIRQNAKLNKNSDLLKKEMLKRRAMYQKNIKESVNQEINCVLRKIKNHEISSANSAEFSENSLDQPFGELNKEGKINIKSMQHNFSNRIEDPNNELLLQSRREMANSSAPVDCANSFSSSGKRESSIYNNNLNNDFSSIKPSSSSKQTTIEQFNHNKSKATKFKKSKFRKLLSNHLSENQFNDQYSTMDTINNETGSNKQKRLYCLCKEPYDSKRFMIGCDLCHNWFHLDCLNLEEDNVKKMASFICETCRDTHGSELDEEEYLDEEESIDELIDEEENDEETDQLIINEHENKVKVEKISESSLVIDNNNSSNNDLVQKISPPSKRKANDSSNYTDEAAQQTVNGVKVTKRKKQTKTITSKQKQTVKQEEDNELYCICKTPYNESQFYVQCENCNEWLHGKCIGLLSKEAEKIDIYLCPKCDPNSVINYANQKELDANDYEQLKKLLKSIQQHKNAWPFLRPVDERQVPDYYTIIKIPMDLSVVENNLNKQNYSNLTKFIGDMTQIFDNCHYYNDAKSSVVSCANNLENFFVQKLTQFRQQMIRQH